MQPAKVYIALFSAQQTQTAAAVYKESRKSIHVATFLVGKKYSFSLHTVLVRYTLLS